MKRVKKREKRKMMDCENSFIVTGVAEATFESLNIARATFKVCTD